MPKKQHQSSWFVLYILVVVMLVALVLEGRDGLPAWANEVVGIGIVLFVFGVIALWVHLNAAALINEELERAGHENLQITVYLPTQPAQKSPDGGNSDSVFRDPFQIDQVPHFRN